MAWINRGKLVDLADVIRSATGKVEVANLAQGVNDAMAEAAKYWSLVATENVVRSTAVTNIWVGTQAEYDALAVKSLTTEYNIVTAST